MPPSSGFRIKTVGQKYYHLVTFINGLALYFIIIILLLKLAYILSVYVRRPVYLILFFSFLC